MLFNWLRSLASRLNRGGESLKPDPRLRNIGASPNVTIRDLQLANGKETKGGGILVESLSTVTLIDVYIHDCNASATSGGGIANYGNLTLSSSYLVHNSAYENGGGLANWGTATISYDSHIFSNSARLDGGGIWNTTGATLSISDNSEIYDNTASQNGGGIANSGTFSMSTGSIYANQATGMTAGGNGGGLYSDAGTCTLTSVTLKWNSAKKGGGVYVKGGTTTLDTCTIGGPNAADHNTASVLGPGGVG